MASLPNRFKIHLAVVLAVCLGFAFTPLPGYSAEVDVYAEGAYTGTDLVLYIYADINSGPILSFGVKVNYPTGLAFVSATKNEAVWYFGDATTKHPYMDPEIGPEGGVIIIGGKLNTSMPTQGVSGPRILLGTVTFTHGGVTDFSDVKLTYAHGDETGTFSNFVGVDGNVKDGGGVSFAIKILKRGDADEDGYITNSDILKVRAFMQENTYKVFADGDGDDFLTNSDFFWIRNNM